MTNVLNYNRSIKPLQESKQTNKLPSDSLHKFTVNTGLPTTQTHTVTAFVDVSQHMQMPFSFFCAPW